MNRRFKLTLAGIGFLGLNGALVPTLNWNFSFPNLSFADLGGGILYKSNPTKKGHDSTKLNLSDSKAAETSLNLDSLKVDLSSPQLNLESNRESLLSLNSESVANQNSTNFSSSIGRIHEEIEREGRVSSINQQLERQYSNLLKQRLENLENKQQEHFKNFQSAKQQITVQAPQNRSKREAPQASLTHTQRDALYRMFNLHNDLKKESKKWSSRLEEEFFNGLRETLLTETPAPLSQISYKTEDIAKSLMEIGWTSRSIKTQKQRSRRNVPSSGASSWGEWNKNPFRHFYSRADEFEKDIKELQSNAEGISQAKQEQAHVASLSKRFLGHTSMWQKINSQLEGINKRITNLEASRDAHIVNKVATFLLKTMGQLN